MKLKLRLLGNTSIEVNPIGFGGIPIQRVDDEKAKEVIERAIKNGINFFDSARGYTCSEEYLGKVLPKYRDKVFIATKSMARTYQKMKDDINISLKNLNCKCIDLYQCHNLKEMNDFETVIGENGAYKALLEAQKEHKIKYIGITSHSYDFIDWLLDSKYSNLFQTIQIPYNFIENNAQPIIQKAHKKGIGTIAMKPLGGGAIDNAVVSIKFLLNDENLSVLIPGMGSVEEVNTNTSIENIILNDNEIEYINRTKEEMKGEFCHRCGYCLPCTKGIDIPGVFTLENYFDKYGLKEWALTRYNNLPVKPNMCIECGACLKRCPYNLDIPKRLKRIVKKFEE